MPKVKREIHRWTEKDIVFLIQNYGKGLKTSELAEKLNVSIAAIHMKASQLKLKKLDRWSQQETIELEAIAETLPIDTLVSRWNRLALSRRRSSRSKAAIIRKLQELGYSTKPTASYLNASFLAEALNVSHNTVISWCKTNLLKHKKNKGLWLIRYEDFARFTLEHPGELSKREVDWHFVLLNLREFTRVVDSRGVKK